MYFKRLRPYIIELVTFLGIMAILVSAIFGGESARSVIIVGGALFLLLWLFVYVWGFVIFAMRVIIDLIFKKYETVTATFVDQFTFKSSQFSWPQKKEKKDVERLYYKILVKCKGVKGFTTLTSTEFFELLPGVKYEFVFGKYSKAIVDIRDSGERVVRFYRGVKLHKNHDIEKKKSRKKK